MRKGTKVLDDLKKKKEAIEGLSLKGRRRRPTFYTRRTSQQQQQQKGNVGTDGSRRRRADRREIERAVG